MDRLRIIMSNKCTWIHLRIINTYIHIIYVYNKCIQVHLLDIIILNLMKMHGKHSTKTCGQNFEKFSNIKFHKRLSSEVRVVSCCRIGIQADRRKEKQRWRSSYSLFAILRMSLKIEEYRINSMLRLADYNIITVMLAFTRFAT